MSQFDDELRHAASRLADEPLPPDLLDESLDHDGGRGHRMAIGAAVAAVVILVVGVGLGLNGSRTGPPPSPTPEPSATGFDPMARCQAAPTRGTGPDQVQVYFPCGSTGRWVDVSRLAAAEWPAAQRLETALRAVLDGPVEEEQDAGLVAVVPRRSGSLLVGVTLEEDGLASVDFDPALRELSNLSTSAAGGAFLESLRQTAFEFPEVTALHLTVAGDCDGFYAILQGACQHLVRPVEDLAGCPIVAPARLPDDRPLTPPRPYPGAPIVSWGVGPGTVRQQAEPGDRPMPSGALQLEVRGQLAWIAPTGDEPLPVPYEIVWHEYGCTYAVSAQFEDGLDGALAYARAFEPIGAVPSGAPSDSPEPTPVVTPPAEPVTATVERDGVRLTVTIDRDATISGVRVTASALVENLGPGSVFWGHSGTCRFPVTVEAWADDLAEAPYGARDWPGDAGILKTITVDERGGSRRSIFSFHPPAWLDSGETMGCTTDLVFSEIPQGGSIGHEVAWDTIGHHGMPPRPGGYTVRATFNFASRGYRPGHEPLDAFSVPVSIPLQVVGPSVAYLSPGEAFDELLADPGYRDALDEAPRSQWLRSRLTFQEERWVAELFYGDRNSGATSVSVLVGVVDARSGEVLRVEIEEGVPPSGG